MHLLFKTLFLLSVLILWGAEGTVSAQSLALPELVSQLLTAQAPASQCEAPPPSLSLYENISLGSLIAGFVFVFFAILADNKRIKTACWALAVLPFAAWGYVNFVVDYNRIQKTIFNLDARAEQTLANIAEAQDRYMSEQGEFIKDLSEVESHLAGAHGLDECVKILDLKVGFEHWDASARHISSPNSVKWDSTSGSSLKKG